MQNLTYHRREATEAILDAELIFQTLKNVAAQQQPYDGAYRQLPGFDQLVDACGQATITLVNRLIAAGVLLQVDPVFGLMSDGKSMHVNVSGGSESNAPVFLILARDGCQITPQEQEAVV